ncbi:PilZ domain protein [Phycisphaerae bacterium RAS1]|nr:PilZ domain protein [Phycisphaerae bacterium RAS1]
MFDFEQTNDAIDHDRAFDMLKELEQNTPDEIRRQRAHFRITVKAKVTLQSGNASQVLDFKVQGVTGDVSEGGCRILCPIPMHVGDIYRLEFDRKTLNIPLTFARCVRCHLLREDAYEVGFAFFMPLSLPEIEQSQETSIL